jgi:hypothetical protein
MHVNVSYSLDILKNKFHMFKLNVNTCDVYKRLRNGIYDATKFRV